jgi:uncharacterized membrane protein YfcA
LAATGLVGFALGVYDGFFGPGTGSFFVFLFVRWLGYGFLNAAASAKLLNSMTNLGALLLLGLKGQVLWRYGLVMALANVAGSPWSAPAWPSSTVPASCARCSSSW